MESESIFYGCIREWPSDDPELRRLRRETNHGVLAELPAGELWPFLGGAVLDTPGFSLFEMSELSQDALNLCYPEFSGVYTECRFTGCHHNAEPDCAVKAMIAAGGMSSARYARYVQLAKEFEQRRKHRYD